MVVMRVARTLRTHWKKSIFFGLLGTYGAKLLYDRNQVNKIMRAYCLEASKIGEKSLNQWKQARHVTVILNPVARDRKSKAQFDAYFAPILNCAGIKVIAFEVSINEQLNNNPQP